MAFELNPAGLPVPQPCDSERKGQGTLLSHSSLASETPPQLCSRPRRCGLTHAHQPLPPLGRSPGSFPARHSEENLQPMTIHSAERTWQADTSHLICSRRCSLLSYCMHAKPSMDVICPERESGGLFFTVQGLEHPYRMLMLC